MLVRMWRNCIIAGGNVKRYSHTFCQFLKNKKPLVTHNCLLDLCPGHITTMFTYNVHATVLAAVSTITPNWKQLNIFH